ncbi:5' nucleotidase, NT5C type [Sphingomicrobium sediminis]|uniref:Uncharacterized protein n=1 Tax=Sphingomicrobium sediminis TaxID=2950949 RepID=A0A9X2J3H9_9SPHN|nr:hypothetical protein [Sphingomicrobium sediminis]MCM8557321.1 hypothetical protein [Sphingomicrobium sediminis]
MSVRLFLDCDGVLADFDGGVRKLTGLSPDALEAERGKGGFWKALARADAFYADLDPLPGALDMVEAVRHLEPTILTGLPMGNWARRQKLAWRDRHLPGIPMITCMARDKWKYAEAGDVLVDDRKTARAPWKEKGRGRFILHKAPETTLLELGKYFEL